MQFNIVVDPERPRIAVAKMVDDQAKKFIVNANMWAVREGSSLSSAVWTVESGGATVGSDTEASNVSTCLVTITSTGEALVKVVLTLADGQIYIQWIRITVRDDIDRTVTRYS